MRFILGEKFFEKGGSMDESFWAAMANPHFVDKLYQTYQNCSKNVPQDWRPFFEGFDLEDFPMEEESPKNQAFHNLEKKQKQSGQQKTALDPLEAPRLGQQEKPLDQRVIAEADPRLFSLLHSFRSYGYLSADIFPVHADKRLERVDLSLNTLGFTKRESQQYFPTMGFLEKKEAPLQDLVAALKKTYCHRIGFDYMNRGKAELEKHLQALIEEKHCPVELELEEKQLILEHLNKSELFETFLHAKYVGQKRFSIEGAETLIPMIRAVLEEGGRLGLEECYLGMAHRGRLNVLSNVLDKSYENLFSEFEESYVPASVEGSGDVKYHKGFCSFIKTLEGSKLRVCLVDNPSHLEAVNPVVQGLCLAKQTLKDGRVDLVLPLLIHGDASIAGQGVVYETLQMGKLEGYSVGGTLHIVVNNQIGFTASSIESRSSRTCVSIAKAFDAPVFHVSAEDPEAAYQAVKWALQIRQKFACDVFICLNAYRKHGHNEIDEPSFTQPLEYQVIREKQSIREAYRDDLIAQGVLEKYMAEMLEKDFKADLENALKGSKSFSVETHESQETEADHLAKIVKKEQKPCDAKVLKDLAKIFCKAPEGFSLHKKVIKLLKQRLGMFEHASDKPVFDWAMAEHLAFASLLQEGVHLRLSGQDSKRGTFSQRHAALIDQKNAKEFFPLQAIAKKQSACVLLNSPLSEFAVLGFEFGYTLGFDKKALVIWEAQFGDFSNGAQIMIDQFLASSEQKWGLRSGLTLLLPHGYEGQGPEHSSARIERFLQLCAQENIIVAYPSTPAQLFHLLRAQVDQKKPLVIFSPKGLLRHKLCRSSLDDLCQGQFQELIDENIKSPKLEKLIFCCGKIYYDLIHERKRREKEHYAFIRLEQIYPFDKERVKEIIKAYKGFDACLWVQEEPQNMGAWSFVRPLLQDCLGEEKIHYVGRKASASPAVGSFNQHQKEYTALMNEVFAKGEHAFYEMSFDSVTA